jgi:pimeloyl-ACP methyl ester carboxylesterase
MIRRLALLTFLTTATALAVGCGADSNRRYMMDIRKEQGLVVILPGIEGESSANHNIRRGLASAGCPRAMPIYNWGAPVPGLGLLINQVSVAGNPIAGRNIARMIENYQDTYPGRPVHIIGHSGGGGMAVFAAEELSDGRMIDGVILLAPSIAAGHDLSKALSRCRNGIVNFYNPHDTLVGLVGGAGVNGFNSPHKDLYQVRVSSSGDAHFAATAPYYVSGNVAPWVLSSRWPPMR